MRDNGRTSFTLVDLARANGIEHTSAHDALSDIEATIGLARLVKSAAEIIRLLFALRQNKRSLTNCIRWGRDPLSMWRLIIRQRDVG